MKKKKDLKNYLPLIKSEVSKMVVLDSKGNKFSLKK
jgi:hypothetical protein